MAALPRFLQGFRLVTGDALNNMIDVINNLTGFGTPQAISGTNLTLSGGIQETTQVLTTDGAVGPSAAATYVITKAGVLAMTLAAPVATIDDGKIITITSSTASAHTLTTVALLNAGTANHSVATFAANAGAGLIIMAYQGKWQVLASVGITFSGA